MADIGGSHVESLGNITREIFRESQPAIGATLIGWTHVESMGSLAGGIHWNAHAAIGLARIAGTEIEPLIPISGILLDGSRTIRFRHRTADDVALVLVAVLHLTVRVDDGGRARGTAAPLIV